MGHKDYGNSHAKVSSETVARELSRTQTTVNNHHRHQHDGKRSPRKPRFFGEHRKYEVVVSHARRQIAELRLSSLGVPLSENSARADRNQTLTLIPTDAVAARIDNIGRDRSLNPVALIVFQRQTKRSRRPVGVRAAAASADILLFFRKALYPTISAATTPTKAQNKNVSAAKNFLGRFDM